MRRHILVTGGSGQVGTELSRLISPSDMELHFPTRADLDLSSETSVRSYLASHEWSSIINCAAYTAVDQAESDVTAAMTANALAPAWLAQFARQRDVPLVHVSTDYVFDGALPGEYAPDDKINPLTVYGASKMAGELVVRAQCPGAIIVRTAWVISPHGRNFLKTMLRLASEGKREIRVVDDQFGSPTIAQDLATALLAITNDVISGKVSKGGTYHFVNQGVTTWAGLAGAIFEISRRHGGAWAQVIPITSAEYPTAAKRPANSALSSKSLREVFGIVPRGWEEALENTIERVLNQKIEG